MDPSSSRSAAARGGNARTWTCQVRCVALTWDQTLTDSDVGLCCYRVNAPQSLTTKLFHYLSHGLPVLGTLPGEMAEFLAQRGVGLTALDAPGCAHALQQLADNPDRWRDMARAALEVSRAHSLPREMQRMADLLEAISRCSPVGWVGGAEE